MSSSAHPVPPSSARSPPAASGAAARSPRAAAAPADADANPDPNPSLRARASRFLCRKGPGGINLGTWAAIAGAAVAVALATWNEQRLQEKAADKEREVLTSSSTDWKNAKQEAKEAAKDARSAASKWSKGQ